MNQNILCVKWIMDTIYSVISLNPQKIIKRGEFRLSLGPVDKSSHAKVKELTPQGTYLTLEKMSESDPRATARPVRLAGAWQAGGHERAGGGLPVRRTQTGLAFKSHRSRCLSIFLMISAVKRNCLLFQLFIFFDDGVLRWRIMRLMPPLIHGKIKKCLTLINWNWGIAKSLPDRARQAMKIIKKLTISRLQIRHGFEGRYSFRESFHLPAIIKEARSISGN